MAKRKQKRNQPKTEKKPGPIVEHKRRSAKTPVVSTQPLQQSGRVVRFIDTPVKPNQTSLTYNPFSKLSP